MKLIASLMVVVFEEEMNLVIESFTSFSVFEEVVVLDMKHREDIRQICLELGFKYQRIERVKIVERIRLNYLNLLRHDWVSYLDPDEVLLIEDRDLKLVNELISNKSQTVNAVYIKWIFHFLNRSLKGGHWRPSSKLLLVDRNRADFSDQVHRGITLKSGEPFCLSSNGTCLNHYWVTSFLAFIEKHWRYLEAEFYIEKEKNDKRNKRLSYVARVFLATFYQSFFYKKGYLDTFIGSFLALFYAFYKTFPRLRCYFSK